MARVERRIGILENQLNTPAHFQWSVIHLHGIIDLEAERSRLKKEIDRLNGVMSGIQTKLGNERFLEKAPAQVVEKEREKLADITATVEKLERSLDVLG